jgi:hypothetical protein
MNQEKTYILPLFLICLAILATFVAILGLLSSIIQKWVSDEERNSEEGEDSSNEKDGQGAYLRPHRLISGFIPHVNAVASAINAYRDKRDSHERGKKKTDRVSIVILGVTAFFAFVAAAAASISAVFLYSQLIDAREAATTQHTDTLQAIALTKAANDETADTAKRELRPYIGVFDSKVGPNGGILVTNIQPIPIDIRDAGRTPAYEAQFMGGVDILLYPLPLGYRFINDQADTARHPTTIYPSSEAMPIYNKVRRSFSQQEIKAIEAASPLRLYSWGTIKYRDAFHEWHFTNFCFSYYDVTAQNAQTERCDTHNDSN